MQPPSLHVDLHFLPENVRTDDVVRRTRHAAEVFLTSATNEWGRGRLRSWLIVEYGMATEWTHDDDAASWISSFSRLDDASAKDLVDDARRRIATMLREEAKTWLERREELARATSARGLVTCVTDCNGREAYAPAARADLGLIERVASLFIADFLSHPDDYRALGSCSACGEVGLGGRVRHARACVRSSGIRPMHDSGIRLVPRAASSSRMSVASRSR